MVFTLIIMVIILLVLTPVGIVVDKRLKLILKIKENLKFKFIVGIHSITRSSIT